MNEHFSDFPIPSDQLPEICQNLMTPVHSLSPQMLIEVAAQYEDAPSPPAREYYHLTMVAVPENEKIQLDNFHCACNGLAASGVPNCDNKGDLTSCPSVAAHQHIISSWGDSAFYCFNLSDAVRMTLGLSGRCLGGEEQRMIYDDLSCPILNVAAGEISSSYYWRASNNISWKIRNDYLRKYLWMTGTAGVKIFYYETYVSDQDFFEKLISSAEDNYFLMKGENFEVRVFKNNALNETILQLHACLKAVSPEKCPELEAKNLIWPGDSEPISNDIFALRKELWLKDSFLTRYEENNLFSATPFKYFEHITCNPSYKGQWHFNGLRRVGRNLIRVSAHDLYKGIPTTEIIHAHSHAISQQEAKTFAPNEESIAQKTHNLVYEILTLGKNLTQLAEVINIHAYQPENYIGFSNDEIEYSHWKKYPILSKLARVSPLDMSSNEFLNRCKTLNEIITRGKTGCLRKLLIAGGCSVDDNDFRKFRTLKLLQTLEHLVEYLAKNDEPASNFPGCGNEVDWKQPHQTLAPFFIINDLRNLESHEGTAEHISLLAELGFDTAHLNEGYGKALDFIFDSVIASYRTINKQLKRILLS